MSQRISEHGVVRWGLLGPLGAAGVLVAHTIGYAVAYPEPHGRELHLAASGHGYWDIAVHAGAVATIVALLGQLALGALAGRRSSRAPRSAPPFTTVFVRLTAVQLVVFVALEAGERLVVGAGMPWSEIGFWLGLPAQVVVAWLGALLLRGAEEAGTRVGALLRAARPEALLPRSLPPAETPVRSRHRRGGLFARAPPATPLSV